MRSQITDDPWHEFTPSSASSRRAEHAQPTAMKKAGPVFRPAGLRGGE